MTDVVSSGKSSFDTNKGIVSINQNDDNFLFYDGSVYRMIVGIDDEGNPLIKISETGISILEATDDQLIFNSSQNVLKVVESGTTTVTGIAGQGSFNLIQHDLGYVPMVLATAHSPNFPGVNRVMMPWISAPGTTSQVIAQISNVTESLLQFEVNLGSAAAGHVGVWDIKYYILQESAN